MSEYRLEACSVCSVVRLAMPSIIDMQRSNLPEWIGDTPVYRIDFCKGCRVAYERAMSPDESAIEEEKT